MILEQIVESPVEFLGATKSQLYAERLTWRNKYYSAWNRWEAFVEALTGEAKARFAGLVSEEIRKYGPWDGTKNKAVLKAHISDAKARYKELTDREDPIFKHAGMNPFVMDDAEKTFYLVDIANMMNSEAVGRPTGAPSEPEFIMTPAGKVIKNPGWVPPKKEGVENVMEYLPFVGIGVGVFRLFFK